MRESVAAKIAIFNKANNKARFWASYTAKRALVSPLTNFRKIMYVIPQDAAQPHQIQYGARNPLIGNLRRMQQQCTNITRRTAVLSSIGRTKNVSFLREKLALRSRLGNMWGEDNRSRSVKYVFPCPCEFIQALHYPIARQAKRGRKKPPYMYVKQDR